MRGLTLISTRFVTGLGASVKPFFCSAAGLYLQLTTLTISKTNTDKTDKTDTAVLCSNRPFRNLKALFKTALFVKRRNYEQ